MARASPVFLHFKVDPKVEIAACLDIWTGYDKEAEQADDDFRSGKIDRKAYDRLGDLRQKGEDAYKRCFTERAEAAVPCRSKPAGAIPAFCRAQ
ncbi:hypothetical protein [Bradyrhizobium sp. sBnM-33]|uniref:hypothetical protein n=1 Tax=Bradyrhizobium sp. sBnM-33 TaxID=2831780 RepID=UPI001BCD8304|nr:hypothetical protein [Bradyrhizobium sp. sBnM-33]WOH47334.1 hypothetical protein RX328_24405 [Bradyrhizobium sp. sBnM-33]